MSALIYYEVTVSWPDPKGVFCVAFDAVSKHILYYSEIDREIPLGLIDLDQKRQNDETLPIALALNISFRGVFIATVRIIQALTADNFEECFSFHSCSVCIVMKKYKTV